jgi:ADP-ribosylglycohydrolase
MDVASIVQRWPPNGPQEPAGNPARVTDDTQMTLAVGEALAAAPQPFAPDSLEHTLRAAFVSWMHSPDNNRAPGNTCMQACSNLKKEHAWQQATVVRSKGCGANMRVAPVGVLPPAQVTPALRAAIAQLQGALTHGHPTALAASDLTAAAIADLVTGGDAAGLPARLRAYAQAQRQVYHADWLGPLWQQAGFASPEEFIARGWDECLEMLDRLDAALTQTDDGRDPCLLTGEGWVAEEAFATGMLCFLRHPDDGLTAIRRAAVTSGDSDSIACLAGAFAGAYLGVAAWPASWLERIEYRERLAALAALWDERSH